MISAPCIYMQQVRQILRCPNPVVIVSIAGSNMRPTGRVEAKKSGERRTHMSGNHPADSVVNIYLAIEQLHLQKY